MSQTTRLTNTPRGVSSQPRRPIVRRAMGTGLLLLTCLCEAQAQQSAPLASQDLALLASLGDVGAVSLSYEVVAERSGIAASDAPLLDLDGHATDESVDLRYRLWSSRGRGALGIGADIGSGTPDHLLRSAGGHGDDKRAVGGATLNLALGMRYRVSRELSIFADAAAPRGLGTGALALNGDPARAHNSTKVGVEWKPAKARFGFERGALGVRLASGYRLALKARRRGVYLYLRGQF